MSPLQIVPNYTLLLIGIYTALIVRYSDWLQLNFFSIIILPTYSDFCNSCFFSEHMVTFSSDLLQGRGQRSQQLTLCAYINTNLWLTTPPPSSADKRLWYIVFVGGTFSRPESIFKIDMPAENRPVL